MIARALRMLFGVAISDPTSGFRLMDREAIRLYAVRYPADFPEPLAIALAVEAGLRVAEAGAVMRERQAGASSIAGHENWRTWPACSVPARDPVRRRL
jgi:hypothetical protein